MPAPPPPPPAPTFNLGGGSADQGRGALLQSIRAGKALKKTVTVDKSAPAIAGKIKGEGSSTSNTTNVNTRSNTSNIGNSINNGNPMGLGGLFAGGMPKLKPTGMRNNLAERDNGNSSVHMGSATLPSVKRGPPPMPPPAAQKPQIFPSNAAESGTNHSTETPRSSFGKPTLAPKPPTTSSSAVQQKPSPPPKKLNLTTNNSVSRAQSMRIPRSPPVLAPTPPSLHQSQDCLNEPMHRPMVTRVLRPPAARPPSPPTSRAPSTTSLSGTTSNGAPITRVAPPPPARAPSMPPPPPPLPHRTSSAATPSGQAPSAAVMTIRQAPPVPPPPTPPTRGQSLQRNGLGPAEFEARFADMFHSIATFPAPEPFRGVTKVYNSKTVAAAAAQKQPAPAPPQRSVSSATSALHSPGSRQQPPQPPSSAAQQWQQQNAASSAC